MFAGAGRPAGEQRPVIALPFLGGLAPPAGKALRQGSGCALVGGQRATPLATTGPLAGTAACSSPVRRPPWPGGYLAHSARLLRRTFGLAHALTGARISNLQGARLALKDLFRGTAPL